MKMNLRELIDAVCEEGYSQANAEARVCQDRNQSGRMLPLFCLFLLLLCVRSL